MDPVDLQLFTLFLFKDGDPISTDNCLGVVPHIAVPQTGMGLRVNDDRFTITYEVADVMLNGRLLDIQFGPMQIAELAQEGKTRELIDTRLYVWVDEVGRVENTPTVD